MSLAILLLTVLAGLSLRITLAASGATIAFLARRAPKFGLYQNLERIGLEEGTKRT